MTFQELFIINLKSFRKIRKLSQFKLAQLCDSTQAYIAEIEVGKKFPSPEMVERIASALGCESYCLFQSKLIEDDRLLTPIQREEIACKVFDSVIKIVNQY